MASTTEPAHFIVDVVMFADGKVRASIADVGSSPIVEATCLRIMLQIERAFRHVRRLSKLRSLLESEISVVPDRFWPPDEFWLITEMQDDHDQLHWGVTQRWLKWDAKVHDGITKSTFILPASIHEAVEYDLNSWIKQGQSLGKRFSDTLASVRAGNRYPGEQARLRAVHAADLTRQTRAKAQAER